MAKKEISVPLSVEGIGSLIKKLERFEKELNKANREFLRRLSEIGIEVIYAKMRTGNGDSDRSSSINFKINGTNGNLALELTLINDDVLFWEFGAGIVPNRGKENPLAGKLGYGVGTYPNQKHAYDPKGWYYWEDGKRYHSFGTEATMPMYSAMEEIKSKITQIVNEVFSSVI